MWGVSLIVCMQILDCKHVTFLPTAHNSQLTKTGKKTLPNERKCYETQYYAEYNQYMGGFDRNDQLLKQATFNRRSVKWWEKVLFRISRKRLNQYEFRINCIKQMVSNVTNIRSREARRSVTT